MKINVKELLYQYGDFTALAGVTFSTEEGAFLGIIGPNGSGKTTLLKLLSRALRPAGGCVLLDELALAEIQQKELARRMAVVTQDGDAGSLFTVDEVVTMGRAPYLGRFQSESPADLQIVRRALELTNCLHLRKRSLAELSGGERQRVMIARALAQEPRVLLLDEPTSHLDIGYQQEILDLVKHLSTAQGVTVVAVLHDLNLAAYYCTTLLLMNAGRVFACGPPAEVITTENISTVYRTRVLVTPHPVLGTPHIALLPGRASVQLPKKMKVHVLAGGGSGGEILRDLKETGYEVSTGVLNMGDSDWEAARALDLPVVSEAPFSPISTERHQENLDLIRRADAVVLTEIPVGRGNIRNLEAAVAARKFNKKLFIVEERPGQARDFTGGEGLLLMDGLQRDRTMVYNEKARLYRALAQLNDQVTKSINREIFSGRP